MSLPNSLKPGERLHFDYDVAVSIHSSCSARPGVSKLFSSRAALLHNHVVEGHFDATFRMSESSNIVLIRKY